MIDSLAQALRIPALRKVREERGTHCVGDASEIKSLGHPPCERWGQGQFVSRLIIACLGAYVSGRRHLL